MITKGVTLDSMALEIISNMYASMSMKYVQLFEKVFVYTLRCGVYTRTENKCSKK